ncbi:MAG: inositol monophosphatase [Proteobacteria bacterium]|nr:MAG: inositol monophosphatase [Pseudomonadota bacterium]
MRQNQLHNNRLQTDQLQELTLVAIEAAKSAGELINSYDDVEIEVHHKGKGGSLAAEVVTRVDLEAQAIIKTALKESCEQHDIAFLGEESQDDGSRFQKSCFWLVDPIDGTLSFCEKRKGYSVSIALVQSDGSPVIGVVYDPISGKLYHATRGLGARINGQQTRSVITKGTTLNCFFDRSYANDHRYGSVIDFLVQTSGFLSDVKITAQGGAVLNACWVLENAPAVYFKFPKDKGGSIWDYAATACIYNELGLPATDIAGEPFELNRKESTYMNHKGLIFASNKELARQTKSIIDKLR